MHAPYINSSFLRGFSDLILAKGGQPAQLYESVGLDKSLCIEEGLQPTDRHSLLIPFDKFIYLLDAAATELDFPDVAMQLARQQDMMILAPLGPMLSRCHTVAEALEVIIQYLTILVSGYQVDIQLQHDYLIATFTMDLPHIQSMIQYQDYAMAIAVRIIHGMLGKSQPIRACYFLRDEQRPQRISAYAHYYGCPIAFNCPSLAITVDRTIMQQDVQHLIQQIQRGINRALSASSGDILDQVSRVISFSLANGRSNIEDIALAMNVSQRTLQRKLKAQQTSYSALLDAVRFNMANQYLSSTYYRLTDIALLLGYSNLSSFSRSYYRWCGAYPTDVRKRVQAQNPCP